MPELLTPERVEQIQATLARAKRTISLGSAIVIAEQYAPDVADLLAEREALLAEAIEHQSIINLGLAWRETFNAKRHGPGGGGDRAVRLRTEYFGASFKLEQSLADFAAAKRGGGEAGCQ